MVFRLNALLADEQVLYAKTRNYHWNVRGMHFQSLYCFFEEQYEELSVLIDDITERIRALGHYVLGTMKSYLDLGCLEESNHVNGQAEVMLRNLRDDHEHIIRVLRDDLIKEAEKFQDLGTSDFVTGVLEKHEKMAWMIRSYLID